MFQTIEELIDFINEYNLSAYAGFASGIYGAYSSYQQTQILNGILDLLGKVFTEINELKKYINQEVDELVVRESLADSISAVKDLNGIEEIANPGDRSTKLSESRSKASKAFERLVVLPDPVDPLKYAPNIVVCASNLILISKMERTLFPERQRQLLSAVNDVIEIMRSLIDLVPTAINNRFFNNTVTIEHLPPARIGGPGRRKINAWYKLDGEKQYVYRDHIIDGGADGAYYRSLVTREIERRQADLKTQAQVLIDEFNKSISSWETLRDVSLRLYGTGEEGLHLISTSWAEVMTRLVVIKDTSNTKASYG